MHCTATFVNFITFNHHPTPPLFPGAHYSHPSVQRTNTFVDFITYNHHQTPPYFPVHTIFAYLFLPVITSYRLPQSIPPYCALTSVQRTNTFVDFITIQSPPNPALFPGEYDIRLPVSPCHNLIPSPAIHPSLLRFDFGAAHQHIRRFHTVQSPPNPALFPGEYDIRLPVSPCHNLIPSPAIHPSLLRFDFGAAHRKR